MGHYNHPNYEGLFWFNQRPRKMRGGETVSDWSWRRVHGLPPGADAHRINTFRGVPDQNGLNPLRRQIPEAPPERVGLAPQLQPVRDWLPDPGPEPEDEPQPDVVDEPAADDGIAVGAFHRAAMEMIAAAPARNREADPDLPARYTNDEVRIQMREGTLKLSGAMDERGNNRLKRRADGVIFQYNALTTFWEIHHIVDQNMIPELNLDRLPESQDKLAPFKLPYTSVEEAQMRLVDSVIQVKGKVFQVTDLGRHGRKDFKLFLRDENSQDTWINYMNEAVNSRSVHPGYVHNGPTVSYLARRPERVFKQGLTHNNTVYRDVGVPQWRTFRGCQAIMQAVNTRKVRKIDDAILKHVHEGLIPAVYLNDNVAVAIGEDKKVFVEYKSRRLGELHENTVAVDEDDFDQSWIKQDLERANIYCRRA